MVKKTGNELILKEESFWKKIKNFLKRLFVKRENVSEKFEITSENRASKAKDDFENSIKIKVNYQEKRILHLQQKLEKNEITVDDISNDEFNQVMKLYKKQIEDLEESTRSLKKSTEYYKSQLEKNAKPN